MAMAKFPFNLDFRHQIYIIYIKKRIVYMFLLRLHVFPAMVTETKWARRKTIKTDLDRGAGTNAWDREISLK
jgi:hypothetical protein